MVSCNARFEDKSNFFYFNDDIFFLSELTALVTHSQQFGADLFQVASEGNILQEFADVLRALVQLQSSEWQFSLLYSYHTNSG